MILGGFMGKREEGKMMRFRLAAVRVLGVIKHEN